MKGRRLDNKKNIYQYYKLSVKIKLSMAQFSIILSLAWKFEQYLWMLLFNIMVIILLFNILLSLRKIIHMLINFMCKYLETSN